MAQILGMAMGSAVDPSGFPLGVEEQERLKKKQAGEKLEIDIVGPLAFWLTLMILGTVLQIFVVPFLTTGTVPAAGSPMAEIRAILADVALWILYLPGAIILPLIVAVWIGERVGASGNKPKAAMTIGVINGFYADLIYAIAIFIIYLLIQYIGPQFFSGVSGQDITQTSFLLWVLVVPVIIVVVLVPIIAGISSARRTVGS